MMERSAFRESRWQKFSECVEEIGCTRADSDMRTNFQKRAMIWGTELSCDSIYFVFFPPRLPKHYARKRGV